MFSQKTQSLCRPRALSVARSAGLSFLAAALLLNGACATMGRDKNEAEVAKVKKAAVVAFVLKAPASNQISVNVGGGSGSGPKTMLGGSSFYQKSDEAKLIFADFKQPFIGASHFSLLPQGYVEANPTYEAKDKMTMSIVQIRDLPPAGQNWYLLDKMMVPQALELLGRDGRNQLMAGLGVDALVAVEVKVAFAGGWKFLGLGGHHPQSTVRFKVFTRDQDDAIWTEWAEGEKTAESTGLTGFMSEDDMLKLARKSAQNAYARIGSKVE